jgi:glycine/D-amino acid oxidase-like deaminating enzyme
MQVVIVGGGVMGSATAWYLAREHGIRATVLERDAGYHLASSARSVCSIRQQFSTAINIQVSQASLACYRDFARHLQLPDPAPAIGLVEPGYLYLAATSAGASLLREQHALQAQHAVHTALLDPDALALRFPWLATHDLQLGSLGLSTATSGEGWFDGYAAMQGFRQAAIHQGAIFRECTVTGFRTTGSRVDQVCLEHADPVSADVVIITAGAWSGTVSGWLGTPLPVRARKRDVFAFEAEATMPDGPLVIDPSGMWFRPERTPGQFLCGAPPRGVDADDLPLDQVDHGLFDEQLWPRLAERVPAFDALRVTASWAGYYEMNTFDHNGLVGALPSWENAYTACGFSGHGLQQAPAVGRGLAEVIATGSYQTLDLTPFRVSRIAENQPLIERNVI